MSWCKFVNTFYFQNIIVTTLMFRENIQTQIFNKNTLYTPTGFIRLAKKFVNPLIFSQKTVLIFLLLLIKMSILPDIDNSIPINLWASFVHSCTNSQLYQPMQSRLTPTSVMMRACIIPLQPQAISSVIKHDSNTPRPRPPDNIRYSYLPGRLSGSDKNCQAVKKIWTSSQHLSQFNKLLLSAFHITATYTTVNGLSLKLLSSNKLLSLRDELKPKQLNTKMLRANVQVVFAILNRKFIN